MRVCDIVISETHGEARTTTRLSPAKQRGLRPLLGHRMGSLAASTGTRSPRLVSSPEHSGVDPRPHRRSRQRGAPGRGHPLGASFHARRGSELETMEPDTGSPTSSSEASQAPGMNPDMYTWA